MIPGKAAEWLRDPHVQIYLWDLIRWCALPNYWVARWRWTGRTCPGGLKLHLGSGDRYVEGWVNIDGKPFLVRKDLWLDLRTGLPFADETVSVIYSSHTFEHFFMPELQALLRECRRVLVRGGVMRVCMPSLERMIAAYVAGDHGFFDGAACRVAGVYLRRSLGGKFAEMLLHHGAHKLAFDFGFLTELMEEAGFVGISEHKFRESAALEASDLIRLEGEDIIEHSLFVEGARP